MFGEDGRRLISDSWKIIDTGVRCFANTAPAVTSRRASADESERDADERSREVHFT